MCWFNHTSRNDEGGGEINKKNTSSLQNRVLRGHVNEFTSLLAFLELRKASHPDDASELSTDDGSRNQRKADEVSGRGRFLYYLLPCHPYGDNHPKHRYFEVNFIALMAHAFTSLLLVFLRFLLPSFKLNSDLLSGCEVYCNSGNSREMVNSFACP